MTNPFTPPFEQLPTTIPIFPLAGAIVLPDVELPLNIFEPRYLSMATDAIKTDRIIGMIQPREATIPGQPTDDATDNDSSALADVGCAGRITSFQETRDGRILIVLTGLCRFRIDEELSALGGYRRVKPDWDPFRTDMSGNSAHIEVEALLSAVNDYLNRQNIESDIQGASSSSASHIINSLTMHLPFEASDKQSLLEAKDDTARGTLLLALCRANQSPQDPQDIKRH